MSIRRSTTRNTPTSNALRISRQAVAAMLCGSDATLTVSAAAPSRTTEGTGILAAARSVTGSPPSMVSRPGASPAIATLSIASRPNAHRHAPNCANRPPIAGPINAPIPHVEAAMAEPRLQSERGSMALITAKAQAAQQTAGESLQEAADQQNVHGGRGRTDQAADTQNGEAHEVRHARADAVQQRIDGRCGDHRPDEVESCHPRIDPLPADLVDRAGQHADREELVRGVQDHAPSDHS